MTMNKKGQDGAIGLVVAVVLMIVGIFIVWGVVSPAVQSQGATQTLTLVNATNVSLAHTNIDDLNMQNSTGQAMVVDTDYTLDTTLGRVKLMNNNFNGTATTQYSYFDAGYVSNSITRTIVGFVVTFFALMVLAFVAYSIKD